MLAMVGAAVRAFVYSREGLEAPDLLLGWVPMLSKGIGICWLARRGSRARAAAIESSR